MEGKVALVPYPESYKGYVGELDEPEKVWG